MSTVPGLSCGQLLLRKDDEFRKDLERFMTSGQFQMTLILGTGDMIIREQPGGSKELAYVLRDKLLSLDLVQDCSGDLGESGFPGLIYMKRLKKDYTRKKLLPIVKETLNSEL